MLCRDDGVGLAAPQVGVNVRLMVFNETAERGNPAETVLVNPEVGVSDTGKRVVVSVRRLHACVHVCWCVCSVEVQQSRTSNTADCRKVACDS
jgi:hypothetical protein